MIFHQLVPSGGQNCSREGGDPPPPIPGPALATSDDSFVFLILRNTKLCETGHCYAEFQSFLETLFACCSRKYKIGNCKP